MKSEGERSVQRVRKACYRDDTEGFKYVVVTMFGSELVIHVSGSNIFGYRRWLTVNGRKSPLFARFRANNLINRLPDLPRVHPWTQRVLLGYRTY